MIPHRSLVARSVLDIVVERLWEVPVILLEGPRAVGKSTLLRNLHAQVGGEILDLDNPVVRDHVTRDPMMMIDVSGPVLIDEYQHAPLLLDAIKARLNSVGEPGQFVLTGSARHEALPRAAQALTGRLHRLPVLPLSQAEIDANSPQLLARLLDEPQTVSTHHSTTTREEYIDRVVRGGFPAAIKASTPGARGRWLDDYVRLTLERDVRELSRLRQAHVLPALLNRLAGQSAQVLNSARAAEILGVEDRVTRDYVRLLEAVFLIRLLPAWDRTLTKRTTVRPKVHLIDTGVAARLLRLNAAKLGRRDAASLTEFGHLLESFVVGELLAQASWNDRIIDSGHWRTIDGVEVDLVLETDDGGILAFEVKTAARAVADDFRGLRALQSILGESFLAGAVLYTGERAYTYADRLHAVPIDQLWACV